ncbi:MAG: serine protease [Planctomycetota bacterium]
MLRTALSLAVLTLVTTTCAFGQFPVYNRPKLNGAVQGEREPLMRLPRLFNRQPNNPSTDTPHPAIVRVECQGDGSIARGSGTLIGVEQDYGYVISNWHVVNQATGPIKVTFPNGYESAATVMKTDEQWDLALLAIWSPPTAPMPLSPRLPEPGEPLIIAGYGQGPFKAVLGNCTDYVSPSPDAPLEMIEVTAPARQGDSGGPIITQAGELAGVLFGSGNGRTTGSHVGRLKQFLDSAFNEQQQVAPNPNAMANVVPGPGLVPPGIGGGGGAMPLPTSTPIPSLQGAPQDYLNDPMAGIDLDALTADVPMLERSPGYGLMQSPKPANPMLPFFLVVGGVAALLYFLPRG